LRLLFPVILAILLIGLVLFGLDDTDISVAHTSVSDIETTIRQPRAGNSSASAMIVIAWTTSSGEGGSNEL